MTDTTEAPVINGVTIHKCVSDIAGERLRSLRKSRRLSVEDMAALCAKAGSPELTANAIYSIENGRRKSGVRTRHVTVDELLALGRAFKVFPLVLLSETDSGHARGDGYRGMDLVESLTEAVQDVVDPLPSTDVAARIRTARRLMAQLALELDEVEDQLTHSQERS